MKTRQDVDRTGSRQKVSSLIFLSITGDVLRTGTGRMVRGFLSVLNKIAFTAFALGKYLAVSGGHWSRFLP